MAKPRRGRVSLSETVARNQAAHKLWASAFDKPPMHFDPLPEKRKRAAPVPSGIKPERDVLRECIAALRKHPSVARVLRNQSGVFKDGDRYVTVGKRGLLDLTIYLRDGRYGEMEIKSETGRLSPEQEQRIIDIRRSGGLAAMARSAESAISIVEVWLSIHR